MLLIIDKEIPKDDASGSVLRYLFYACHSTEKEATGG